MPGELESYFFEGAEKLLEIWFSSSFENNNSEFKPDLRQLSREDLDGLLDQVKCTIISKKSTETMDSYVLSESSLFITKDRLILKTCGTTTLLRAIEPIMKLAREKCNFDNILDIFFSRKSFQQPQRQIAPHHSFSDEANWLDEVFTDGQAYTFGPQNKGCDSWNLYTISPHAAGKEPNDGIVGVNHPDQTLELLMTELDEEVMKTFFQQYSRDGEDARIKSGIDKILPGSVVDDFLFEPCGYSANGLLADGQYWTIHITPETEFSYVSFETNVEQKDYGKLIGKVLDVFKPGKFVMSFMSTQGSIAHETHMEATKEWGKFGEFRRTDFTFALVKNYSLTYSLYKNSYS